MRHAAEQRWQTLAFCCIALAALIMPTAAPTQQPSRDGRESRDSMELSIELVDPKVLRVCADPHNLPFSNEKLEGFENKLAELFAKKLDKSIAYTWFPQATGFVRQTLGAHRCDVIMGFPQGDDLVQSTNPYYRTAYAFIFKPGSDLEGIDSLSDERLKSKRIGIVAGTPAATYLAMNSLLARAKPYALMVDTRVDSSAEAMVRDLKSGEIDVGILWGPMAGYYAKQENPALRVVPILKESGGPRLAYRLTMGVRAADQAWKRQLNRLIQENQPEIDKLLISFGVPLLDEKDQPITEDTLTKKP
jgi:quinoprotein dehydrogenase-associated probable ABC transporter substrate-binding protein